MRQLAADPNVASVEIDQRMTIALTPNDPSLSNQWAFGTTTAGINVRPAWEQATCTGVVVAVIDTGITSHPDLNANILQGYDFVSDADMARDGNGRDSNPADQGDWIEANGCYSGSPATHSSWHGTHVAGTIAVVTNNSTGLAGTAFNAKILPVRALGRCGGYTSGIVDAITWASGGTVSGVPANTTPAEVINMSLGGSGACSTTYQNAINAAVGRGTTVVVAAGNRSVNVSTSSPANCANVIAVAATTSSRPKASYSNYGSGIDISAPGSSILSTLNDGTSTPGNARYDGTSMAAPHVAGVAALVLSASLNPLTPVLLEARLKATASALPVACTLGCGAGLVNAGAVVAATLKPQTPVRGVPLGNLALKAGTSLYYQVSVPAGTHWLKLALAGGSGNADLSLRGGSLPTDTLYGCRSIAAANAESCPLNLPAGTDYVRVKAVTAVAGVGVTASY